MASIVAYASVFAAVALGASNPTYVAYRRVPTPPASWTLVCLKTDGAGAWGGPDCRRGQCVCPTHSTPYVADYCKPGERGAPNQTDANKARAAAAASGTLRTATFEGRRFCVHYVSDPFRPSDPIDNGVSFPPESQ